MGFELGPRRGIFVDISRENGTDGADIGHFEQLDLMYRSLCAMLYNYVPTSGHPGGSISSGRFLSAILFDSMNYDVSDPDREDADLVSLCGRPQDARPVRHVGPAQRDRARRDAPRCCPRTKSCSCGWRTCSGSAATRCRAHRSFRSSGSSRWTATPRRPPPSCACPRGPPAWGSRPRSASRWAPWIITAARPRACISSRARAA